jgi:hypothetical protein
MIEHRFTRPYLESLTTRELVSLADNAGLDIPPVLERIFIIEELLDLESEYETGTSNDVFPGEEEKEAPVLKERGLSESMSLPKQYNITYIEVILRDPLWVFAFWEIKGYEKELYEKSVAFGGYHLKVSPLDAASPENAPFTIPVETGDSAWYIGFPPGGGRFKVELCVQNEEAAIVLAVSRPFRLPKLSGASTVLPLGELSGADDLQVLRNVDRQSRIYHSCNG